MQEYEVEMRDVFTVSVEAKTLDEAIDKAYQNFDNKGSFMGMQVGAIIAPCSVPQCRGKQAVVPDTKQTHFFCSHHELEQEVYYAENPERRPTS